MGVWDRCLRRSQRGYLGKGISGGPLAAGKELGARWIGPLGRVGTRACGGEEFVSGAERGPE